MDRPLVVNLLVLTPRQAWELLGPVGQYGSYGDLARLIAFIGDDIPEEVAEEPVEALDFSVRTQNILKRAHITKTGELLGRTANDLLGYGLKEKGVNEVREKLRAKHSIGLLGDPLP